MKITYQSKSYSAENVAMRYVRAARQGEDSKGSYFFCEVNKKNLNIRTGYVTAEEVPADVRTKADKLQGQCFSFVDWPL